jgi:hypothetical protein
MAVARFDNALGNKIPRANPGIVCLTEFLRQCAIREVQPDRHKACVARHRGSWDGERTGPSTFRGLPWRLRQHTALSIRPSHLDTRQRPIRGRPA